MEIVMYTQRIGIIILLFFLRIMRIVGQVFPDGGRVPRTATFGKKLTSTRTAIWNLHFAAPTRQQDLSTREQDLPMLHENDRDQSKLATWHVWCGTNTGHFLARNKHRIRPELGSGGAWGGSSSAASSSGCCSSSYSALRWANSSVSSAAASIFLVGDNIDDGRGEEDGYLIISWEWERVMIVCVWPQQIPIPTVQVKHSVV